MRHVPRRIHLAGIGGAGMSGLAELLHAYGHTVTGSDREQSPVTVRLEKLGVAIQYDHVPRLVLSADLLIYSSAIREDNPERVYARGHCAEMRRAEALGELMRAFTTICIAGTHGKTTTTSLTGAIMTVAGQRPTVLVGGTLIAEGAPVIIGRDSGLLVAEADEYDRSFLAFSPTIALITNIEADHLDCYENLDAIKDAFAAFAARVPFYGAVVCCSDDAGVRAVMPKIDRRARRVVTYGTASADFCARNIEFAGGGLPSFDVVSGNRMLGRVTLTIPGMHNVLNALGAIAAAMTMGIDFEPARAALSVFAGVRRRFEIVGRGSKVTVIDDYAHHPGEIAATLDAARRSGFARIIAVFQPHLYSRTRDFLGDFALSLSAADTVIVAPIYKSREEPVPGVSGEAIVAKLRERGFTDAYYVADKREIQTLVESRIIEGAAVVVMGAGDITLTARSLAEALNG
jgi:UDP-N-acetylmuramate--alanine ligase